MADTDSYRAFLVNARTGIREYQFTSTVDEQEILQNPLFISCGVSGRQPGDVDVQQVRAFLGNRPVTQYLDTPWALMWLDTRTLNNQS